MATNYTSSSNPGAEKMGDFLDALSSGIAKTAANEPKFEPKLLAPEVPDKAATKPKSCDASVDRTKFPKPWGWC